MMSLKIVFMGTPSFAVPSLANIHQKYGVSLVVCQPDGMKDRKGNYIYSPVKKYALENNIPIIQPIKISDAFEEIKAINPDLLITCAYGQFIPDSILNLPTIAAINIHGSLLPKLRGGAPIHHAIINDYDKTGVTIMYMAKKMDAGDIISSRAIDITDEMNLDYLYNELSIIGSELIMDTLPSIIDGTNDRIVQNEEEVTFGYNVTKEEEHIDFNKTSRQIFCLVRGLSTIPGAFAWMNEKRLKIFKTEILNEEFKGSNGEIVAFRDDGFVVKTSDGGLLILEIQPEGKPKMSVNSYLNGIDKKALIGIVLR